MYRLTKIYKPFDELGIKTEDEFIRLIEYENVIKLYEKVKEILRF